MMTGVVLQQTSSRLARHSAVSDRIYIILGNLVVALVLVGYPLSASLSQFLGQVTSEFNIAFRLIHVALSLSLLIVSLSRKDFYLDKLIILFFCFYIIRLWWDFSYSFLPDIERDIQFFVAVTLFPVISMVGSRAWFNERMCIMLTAYIGGLAGIFIAYNLALGSTAAAVPELNQRASLELLNPISIGYHGLFIATAATVILARYRTITTIMFAVPIVIMGTYLLIAAGSRGPFVALAVGLLVTSIASRRAYATYAVAALILGGLLIYFGAPEIILNRFRDAGLDESSLQRIYTSELSIDLAIKNPLVGYAYIEPVTGRYPHNLIVEAGMALGVGGFVLLIWMQLSLLLNAWFVARNGQWFLPFIAAASFANAWISGSIWGSALFFVTLWLVRGQRHMSGTRQNRGHA